MKVIFHGKNFQANRTWVVQVCKKFFEAKIIENFLFFKIQDMTFNSFF